MHPSPLAITDWHTLSARQVADRLDVDIRHGLDSTVVRARIKQYGSNEIQESASRSLWGMFLSQFTDFMILVLIVAAIISGIVGHVEDTLAILAIVIINAIIGMVQEYRAEKAIAALRQMSAPEARVLREAELRSVAAHDIVPGDVVVLEAGQVIPADLRLLEVIQLKIDEAALTGESQAVEKTNGVLADPALPLGDRSNMAFKGTLVSNGRGKAIVVATGMATELGKIATLLSQERTVQTPLQKRLAGFGKRLALGVLVICAVIFTAGVLREEPLMLMFLTAVSLAVAAIPEALPAVVTVALAIGAHKMSKHHALIRRLPAVETLGSVTYICSDKTGTLTQNKMHVDLVFADGRKFAGLHETSSEQNLWRLLGEAMVLSNDAREDATHIVKGDPTEVALYRSAQQAGYEKHVLESERPRVGEIPFDTDRKCMTTLHRYPSRVIAFTKGAPEMVLDHCRDVLTEDGPMAIDVAALADQAERLAAKGYRVLALAYRDLKGLPAEVSSAVIERELTLLGLVALIDPPRDEAPQAVVDCRTAGITPVMITGDHPATAQTIAVRLGISAPEGGVITGRDLDQLSPAEFQSEVERIRVYARVSPQQKIKIIKALQDRHEYVAMTGDGVNDAPALKRANIGVAMGLKGTDVAREAADMVLLDDNFATIVRAVREGRRIFDNIRKFIKYTLTTNAGEIWTLFLAPLLGLPLPLLPLQILWINLVTDSLPCMALAAEPQERGIMHRPPRPPEESLFAHGIWQHIIWVGLLIGIISIAAQAWAYHSGIEHWQTIVFTVLTFSQLTHVMAIRSDSDSLFTIGVASNRPLLGAVLITILLQLAVIYVPFMQPLFNTHALAPQELALCFGLPCIVFVAVELEKWMIRRGWLYKESAIRPAGSIEAGSRP